MNYYENADKLAHDDLTLKFEPFKVPERVAPLRAFIGKVEGKLLDVGCGGGELLEILEADGVDCIGLDIAEPYLAHCRSLGLQVLWHDAETPIPLSGFSVVVLSELLEHVLNPKQVIKNSMDALAEDGRLIVMVPWMEDLSKYAELSKTYTYLHLRNVDDAMLRDWFGEYRVTRRRYATPYPPKRHGPLKALWKASRSSWKALNTLIQLGLCKPVNVMVEVKKW